MRPTCPNCQSTDVTYRSKKECYICEDCNHEFVPEVQFEPLRIFLSYGHDEYASFAQKLRDDLVERGHEVWFDVDRLKPGGDWEQYIEEGLDWVSAQPGKGRMILIMTPHSVRRPDGFCLNEISRALDHHLFIIPVMLVWSRPPLTLTRIQWLDMQHSSKLPVPEGPYTISKNYLIEALEHERLNFEGQASMLRENLNPLSFEADIIHYQKWFTGRKWVFDKIDKWLQDESNPRLFWITGLPGIGKTAIAVQLRERMPNMVAFHLCRRGNSDKASPRRTVMSIAHQLSTQLPDYAERLAAINLKQLLSDPDVNVAALFDALIVQPLAKDIQRPPSPQVILIDGLDEATQDGRNVLAEFIANEFVKLPDWLRLIITSRPDPEVTYPLQAWDRWTLETEAAENRNDLNEYINKMLKPIHHERKFDLDRVVNTILENSQGIFLYAEWVCHEIREGKLSPDSPEQFPKGLGGIYAGFFNQKLTTDKNFQADIATYQQRYRPCLELILASREPLDMEQIDLWMGWTEYDEEAFFKKFGSLFLRDTKGVIRPFHTSVLDWLGDRDKAGDFFVDIRAGHLSLTVFLWNEFEQKRASGISQYALRQLPFHLTNNKEWDKLVQLLCNLDFIQAKAAAKMIYELVNDFNAALEVIPDNADNIQKEKERQERMEKYTKDLIACAKGEITLDELDIPESIPLWTEEQIDAEIERKKNNPTRADRLHAFLNFLSQEAENLQNHAHELPNLVVQQAWNYADSGPVGEKATQAPEEKLNKLLLRIPFTRPLWNPLPLIIKTLSGPVNQINCVAVTPNGKMAVSASSETCIVWDLETGQALKKLSGHSISFKSIAVTPDGKWAVSVSWNETYIVWDLETGKALKTLSGYSSWVKSVVVTPDGKRAVTASSNICIVWDIETGNSLKTLYGHSDSVLSVAITPDGKRAVSASDDKTCIVWDIGTGKALKILSGHRWAVNSVVVTPDGKRAVSASSDQTCIVWDLETGKVLKTLSGHSDGVNSVAVTPDGKRAVSASNDQTCIVWDLETGKIMKMLFGHSAWVNSVAVTPDGKRAVSACFNTCIVWDLETGNEFSTLPGHIAKVDSVVVTPNGKRAVTASLDQTCIVWDIETGKALKMLSGHSGWVKSVAVTPDGKMAVSASWDKTCIVWEIETGKALRKLSGHSGWVNSVAVTPDGKRAVSASWDETCIVWDLKTGKVLKTFSGHIDRVDFVAITPNGKRVVSASNDNSCIVWELETGRALNELSGYTGQVNSVASIPDGKSVVFARSEICYVCDIKAEKAFKLLFGHSAWVNSVVITPDGKRAISASSDRTCIVWDLETGKALKSLVGHTHSVRSVAITPDGKRVVSASDDKTCIVWDLETGKKLAQFFTNCDLDAVAWIPYGICAGGSSGEVFFIEFKDKTAMNNGNAIVTIRQIWDAEKRFSQSASADCPLCGHRFAPPASVLASIEEITKKAGLRPDQSPCLELPDETWEDPRLLSNCPNCGEGLKFNPFIA